MSLLNVTVKRASYVGDQASQFNTFVTLKLQNVKSTTVTVKGAEPCWEQDFLFETTSGGTGLLAEVFSKEMMILNRPLGYKFITLDTIPYGYPNEVTAKWYTLDHELIMENGEVVGTKDPTGHMILLDCRFELPYDADVTQGIISSSENYVTSTSTTTNNCNTIPYYSNNDQSQRQTQYLTNSGYSEDSAYTSEFNYPVTGQKISNAALGPNSNQYISNTGSYGQPKMHQHQHHYNHPYNQNTHMINTARDNSYEFSGYYDDGSGYNNSYNNQMSVVPDNSCYQDDVAEYEQDELYYNSRPLKGSSTRKTSGRLIQSRRSLERQDTLYDDIYNGTDSYSDLYNNYQNDSFDQYDASTDYISEDRQWDSGGRHTSYGKRLPDVPTVRGSTSVSEGLYYSNKRGASLPATPLAQKRNMASHRMLPQPAVTKSPKMLPQVPVTSTNSISRGKRKMPTPIIKTDIFSDVDTTLNNSPYHRQDNAFSSSFNFNEDYNYAYESPEAINDNSFHDSYSNSSRKIRTAALPSVPQLLSKPAVNDSSNILQNSYDVYNVMTQQNSFHSNNLTSSSLINNDSTYGIDENKQDDLYGIKSTPVKKQLPQPSKFSILNKLPTIPNITNSLYNNDPLQSLETKSTNDNEDSMFSRFNSYESESVPYSTSNDLSIHTVNNSSSKYDTTSGLLYGNGDAYATDMDFYGAENENHLTQPNEFSYQMQLNKIGISDTITAMSGILSNSSNVEAATTTTTSKTLPPIPDNAYSKLDTQNSNLYISPDYKSMNLTNNYLDSTEIRDEYGTTTPTNNIMSHIDDYHIDEQYNTNQNLTANHLTDSAYTSDYYENCQYDYEYTENETDYLASGDIIEKGKTNFYPNNNNSFVATVSSATTVTTSTTASTAFISSNLTQQSPMLGQAKQQEPNKTASILGQSKSLLGGLSNMIGSSISKVITNTTELAKPPAVSTMVSVGGTATASNVTANTQQFNSSSIFSSSMPANNIGNISSSAAAVSSLSTINNSNDSVLYNDTVDIRPSIITSDYNNLTNYNNTNLTTNNLIDDTNSNALINQHQIPHDDTILEPYHEDYEDEFGNVIHHDQQINDETYLNGYYDETTHQQQISQNTLKPQNPEDSYYNTYDNFMVFNEEDEDQYHEQEKLEEQLEEYKEDFEEDFLAPTSKPHLNNTSLNATATTQDNTNVTTSQTQYTNNSAINNFNNNNLNNQRSLPMQDSFDELEYETQTNKNSRMLQKQDTILSEATEYIEDEQDKQNHVVHQDSLLPEDEHLENHENDMYAKDNKHYAEIHEDIGKKEDTPPRKTVTISDDVPTVLKEKLKPKPTAKERWHWAYNKIIMQLNVSTYLNFLFIFYQNIKMCITTTNYNDLHLITTG